MAKQRPTPPASKVPPRGSAGRAKPGASRRPPTRSEANRRRRQQRWLAIVASAVVLIVVAVLVIVKVSSGSGSGSNARATVTAAQLDQLGSVPVSTLVAAAGAAAPGTVSPPTNLPATTPALTSAGKPQIVYIGAEYCPYCAAERWPLVMALSKFGTFHQLSSTKSSSTDVNANTPTFSFYGSSYTSPYLDFTSVELQDRLGKPLEKPTAAQTKLINTYDAPPYTQGSGGSIPFVDLGGRFLISGTEYDGAALSNKSFDSAVGYMTSASNPTSRAAEAVAGHLIGVMCSLTNDQPATVCASVPASLKTGQAVSGNQGSSSGG